MKVWMIWAYEPYSDHYWLVDAWDDDSVMENNDGWEEAKKKAYEDHGPEEVRITTTTVDIDKVAKAFKPQDVGL